MLKYILLISVLRYSEVASAQVHVRDEPRHHNVFENDLIRILDVHFGPGDTTLYHLHNTPSVFIIFTNTKLGSQLAGGPPQEGANVTGEIAYDSIHTPRTHRVWNHDTNWFHVMDIELTGKKQNSHPPLLQNEFMKLLFNEKEVNGYKAALKPGKELRLPASVNGYLVVSLDETVVDYKNENQPQRRIMKAGHYIWIEAGKKTSLSPGNQSSPAFVILQIK